MTAVGGGYGAYRPNGQGRAAYDPAMIALLMYGYANRNCSSRGIEKACVEDVAYRVIAAWVSAPVVLVVAIDAVCSSCRTLV